MKKIIIGLMTTAAIICSSVAKAEFDCEQIKDKATQRLCTGEDYDSGKDFTCEMIKEKKVRKSCIADRVAKENVDRVEKENADKAAKADIEEKQKFDIEARHKFVDGANIVIKAYRKLQYKTETGIGFSDFVQSFQDAQVEFKMFESSPDAQYHNSTELKVLKEHLFDADYYYKGAKLGWELSIHLEDNDKSLVLSDFKSAAGAITKAENSIKLVQSRP